MRRLGKSIATAMVLLFLCAVNTVAQQKLAFLVGISDYGNANGEEHAWTNISGANDVCLLSPQFTQQGFHVETLVDGQATYKNITTSLDKVAKECTAGAVVYLHFSMHGQPVEDMDGDESDGWDEAVIPIDAKKRYEKGVYEGERHLIDDDLEEYADAIRSKIGVTGILYVVLDACHSGEASRGGEEEHVRGTMEAFSPSGKYYIPAGTTNDYFSVSTKKGQSPVVFLEACRSDQQNKEVRDPQTNMWYGPLSYHIYEAMKEYTIGTDTAWVAAVKSAMEKDRRIHRQNMVIEEAK